MKEKYRKIVKLQEHPNSTLNIILALIVAIFLSNLVENNKIKSKVSCCMMIEHKDEHTTTKVILFDFVLTPKAFKGVIVTDFFSEKAKKANRQ